MNHKELKQAIKDRKTLLWNDPSPIEGNDYTVKSVRLNEDDETAYITYGEGSEAEVYYSELLIAPELNPDKMKTYSEYTKAEQEYLSRRASEHQEFKDFPKITLSEEEEDRISKKGILDADTPIIACATDWRMKGNNKYGRLMYSKSLDRFRGLTMGEFYGNGIVD